jgi:hypothetical protein
VKGQVTSGTPDEGFVACGDGTAFPMEVTLDQLAEIFYRVKSSETSSGSVTFQQEFDDDPYSDDPFRSTVEMTEAEAPENLFETYSIEDEFVGFSSRGYHASIDGESPDQPMNNGFSAYFEEVYYRQTDYGPSGDPAFDTHKYAIRDMKPNERGMWANKGTFEAASEYALFLEYCESPKPFRTGFSFTSAAFNDAGTPSDFYGVINTLLVPDAPEESFPFRTACFSLEFSGEVAWFGADSPLSPDARIFVGLACYVCGDTSVAPVSMSTRKGDSGKNTPPMNLLTGTSLVLDLHDGPISCPFYGPDPDETDGVSVYEATDFVMTATEWWPYAKDSPALPVWNTETGARL